MSQDLKQKTIYGFLWSSFDKILLLCSTFTVGVILARLLSPEEFGLIGIVTSFIVILRVIIDGGFVQAIIRKKNPTQVDYSTMFYFNVLIGLLSYFIIFLASNQIALFFNQSVLEDILIILTLVLIVDSFSIVYQARLTREIDFKSQAFISVFSTILSGSVGIFLAYTGHGIWSLVIMIFIQRLINLITLVYRIKWFPSLDFSLESLKGMFSFGYKLSLSSLIYAFNRNIHYLVIAKYLSIVDVGYYNRATKFMHIPAEGISSSLERVSYPVFSIMGDDKTKLESYFHRIVNTTMFLTFPSMLFLAAVSEHLILFLIGEKWLESVVYLQLLCFAGMLYPLHTVNLNILKIKGRSDLFLFLEVVKFILSFPSLIICVYYGIEWFIIAIIITYFLFFFLNSYFAEKYVSYSSIEQLKEIFPSFLLSFLISLLIFSLGSFIENYSMFGSFQILLIQSFTAFSLFFSINEMLKFEEYIYLKKVVKDNLGFSKHNLQKA